MQTFEQFEASIVKTNRIACAIDTIFRNEFSDVSKAIMAAPFAGLIALVRGDEFEAAKILINGVSTVPPGVTEERFAEVKQMLLDLFP